MMSSEFEFRSGKPNSDWHHLSSFITDLMKWQLQFQTIGGPSDLSKGVSTYKLSSEDGLHIKN